MTIINNFWQLKKFIAQLAEKTLFLFQICSLKLGNYAKIAARNPVDYEACCTRLTQLSLHRFDMFRVKITEQKATLQQNPLSNSIRHLQSFHAAECNNPTFLFIIPKCTSAVLCSPSYFLLTDNCRCFAVCLYI